MSPSFVQMNHTHDSNSDGSYRGNNLLLVAHGTDNGKYYNFPMTIVMVQGSGQGEYLSH